MEKRTQPGGDVRYFQEDAPSFLSRQIRWMGGIRIARRAISKEETTVKSNKKRCFLWFVCCAFLLLVAALTGEAQYRDRTTLVYSTVVIQTWKLKADTDERRLTQFSLPLFITHSISSRLQVSISEANAVSTVALLGDRQPAFDDDESLSGIGDTKIRFSYRLVPARLLVNAGVNLPTGKSRLSLAEAQVFRQFSTDTLGFHVGRLGEGPAVNVSLVGTQPVGPVSLGFGVAYFAKGTYDPLDIEGDASYNPGDQYSAVLGVNWETERLHFRNSLIFTGYTTDQFDDTQIFRQGPETIIENSINYHVPRFSGTIYLRNTIWQKSDFSDIDEVLIPEEKNRQGRRVVVALSGSYRLNRLSTLTGLIENQRRLENELNEGEANVVSVGGGFRTALTRWLSVEIGVRFSQGYMMSDTIDLQGLSISSGLVSRF